MYTSTYILVLRVLVVLVRRVLALYVFIALVVRKLAVQSASTLIHGVYVIVCSSGSMWCSLYRVYFAQRKCACVVHALQVTAQGHSRACAAHNMCYDIHVYML
jgi:hypothetical protein